MLLQSHVMDLKKTETEENYVRPSGDRIVHCLEQQPCGVQVVERVGLVVSGFCVAVQFSAPFLLFFSLHKNIGRLNR